MKKLTSIALTLLLLLTLVAGCSTPAPAPDAAKTADAAATEAPAATEAAATQAPADAAPAAEGAVDTSEEVTIKWMQIGAAPKDQPMVLEAMNKILKEKINVKLEMTNYDWGDYDTKAKLAINSGEDYDIFFTCSWAADYAGFAAQGAFVRLDDPENNYFEKYGKDMLPLIDPGFLSGSKINGANYTVPTQKELGYQAVWNINKNVADKYGIKKEDFTDVAALGALFQKVKDGEGANYYPSQIDWEWLSGNQGKFESIIDLVGVQYTPDAIGADATKVVFMPQTEDYKNYITITTDYAKKGFINPDAATPNSEVPNEQAKTGDYLVGAYHYMPLAEISDSVNKGYPLEVQPIHKAITATWSTTGSTNAISINSKNPERAMMFLNLINSDAELRQLLGYGIEGTHYTLNDKDQMIRTKEQADAYAPPNFALGNVMITKLTEGDPEDKWAQFQAFNTSCVDSPILGFVLNKDPIVNEIAALQNIQKEYHRSLCFGASDPETKLPEFIKKMEEAGLQKVIDEVQKQVDAFVAAKAN